MNNNPQQQLQERNEAFIREIKENRCTMVEDEFDPSSTSAVVTIYGTRWKIVDQGLRKWNRDFGRLRLLYPYGEIGNERISFIFRSHDSALLHLFARDCKLVPVAILCKGEIDVGKYEETYEMSDEEEEGETHRCVPDFMSPETGMKCPFPKKICKVHSVLVYEIGSVCYEGGFRAKEYLPSLYTVCTPSLWTTELDQRFVFNGLSEISDVKWKYVRHILSLGTRFFLDCYGGKEKTLQNGGEVYCQRTTIHGVGVVNCVTCFLSKMDDDGNTTVKTETLFITPSIEGNTGYDEKLVDLLGIVAGTGCSVVLSPQCCLNGGETFQVLQDKYEEVRIRSFHRPMVNTNRAPVAPAEAAGDDVVFESVDRNVRGYNSCNLHLSYRKGVNNDIQVGFGLKEYGQYILFDCFSFITGINFFVLFVIVVNNYAHPSIKVHKTLKTWVEKGP